MGMLKRKNKQVEISEDIMSDDNVEACESYSTTSEEENSEIIGQDSYSSDTKTKVLILASRGVNSRQRHLLEDFCLLMPHVKKESKFDSKKDLFVLNELAELNGCNHVLYFEAKKPQELFLWVSKSPSGPSARFHIQNIHTLDELHLTGNCMKNTRPILSFDSSFEESEKGLIMQELLSSIFNTPENNRKTRPFFDRVLHFAFNDDRIWVRNYEIKEGVLEEDSIDNISLEEIGPRFVMHPVRIFEGSFKGKTIWKNENFIPHSITKATLKMGQALKNRQRSLVQDALNVRKQNSVLEKNELDHVFD